ncbi:STAS domain-containing protein [Lusitaniella coriacea LEGE 07157]|uniref:STAS domain-containing protein n=1 Tax=Lusitaniella coriacea LEGE 07157 TaxID=945747 RepID=A0A8J7J5M3_9CYAN|nr:STAS domain-containing protein [Lusitaniella coriacea]MBE9118144.1 STAS domain-containing protein [Lusitaniella coriacea LEGE 07157]
MDIQEITGENYTVRYAPENTIIYFKGSLRLSGIAEYTPIANLVSQIVEEEPKRIILNLKELEFLNSSGISMLSKFIINLRKKQTIQVIVKGSDTIPWQGKSLKNLQRLMPSLILELE